MALGGSWLNVLHAVVCFSSAVSSHTSLPECPPAGVHIFYLGNPQISSSVYLG